MGLVYSNILIMGLVYSYILIMTGSPPFAARASQLAIVVPLKPTPETFPVIAMLYALLYCPVYSLLDSEKTQGAAMAVAPVLMTVMASEVVEVLPEYWVPVKVALQVEVADGGGYFTGGGLLAGGGDFLGGGLFAGGGDLLGGGLLARGGDFVGGGHESPPGGGGDKVVEEALVHQKPL